jgi:hypothetical protein
VKPKRTISAATRKEDRGRSAGAVGQGEGWREGCIGGHLGRESCSLTLAGASSQALRTNFSYAIVSRVRDIQSPSAIDRNTDIIQQSVGS